MTNPQSGTLEGGERELPKSPRRRPATIDLEATEIVSDPQTSPDPAGDPAGPRTPGDVETARPPPEEPPQAPPPPAAPPREDAVARPSRHWPIVAAFVAGAGMVALMGLAVWFLGAVPPQPGGDRDSTLAAKVAALDRRISALTTPSAPRQPDLEARLAALEAARSSASPASDPRLSERIGALELRLNDMAREMARREEPASRASDESAAATNPRDVPALTARVASLEQRLRELKPAASSDRAVRLGLAAMELRLAVERGSPFSTELAAVSRLLDDPSELAPLKAVADIGLPAPGALAQALSKLTPTMLTAAGKEGSREGSMLDRLEAGAERLVRIRRIDDPPGDDPAAVIARAEIKATHGDIAGSLAEIDKLPDKVRAPASAWIGSARARLAALDAARQLSVRALQALGSPAP
jgi:hypothetical protein